MTKVLLSIIAAAMAAAVFTYFTNTKDQSTHIKAVATCTPQLTIVPWERRGYFLKYGDQAT